LGKLPLLKKRAVAPTPPPPPPDDEPPTERAPDKTAGARGAAASAADEGVEDAPTVASDEPEEDDDSIAATHVYDVNEARRAMDRATSTVRGGAAESPGALAAPRRFSPDPSASSGEARTGDTRRAPDSIPPKGSGTLQGAGASLDTRPIGTQGGVAVAAKTPPVMRSTRTTLHGALPPPPAAKKTAVPRITGKGARDDGTPKTDVGERDSAAFELKKPVPPMRGPLSTSEFTGEDSMPCHACGSIISRNAEVCMYCGATTGSAEGD
jgi:hypothetical protein